MIPTRRAIIVIPAYEPGSQLIDLVEALSGDGRPLVVVDDGSSIACAPVFARIASYANVVVLAHAVNLGKGQALKTAFNYVLLNTSQDAVGVVTADADGQHLPADVRRVAERLEERRYALVLGSRAFRSHVPLRSRVGNVLTRAVFRVLIGRHIRDTQTGLRGIPRAFLPELIQLEANRYEFELEMLVRAADRGVEIEELPIQTVYGPFAISHFNPLRDSLRIYFVFLRFVGLSAVTAGVDYAVFAVVYASESNILLSTIAARAVAGTFNFTVNKTVVFRSRGSVAYEAIKYAILVVALMSVSYGLVMTLVLVAGFGVYTSKLMAEGALFAASFAMQNLFVFPNRRLKSNTEAVTNWDRYYRSPGWLTPLTRRITARLIVDEIVAALAGSTPDHIVELGGGNSPFLAVLRRRYPRARLTAVDTNRLGLDLLEARLSGDTRIVTIQDDVLTRPADGTGADVVFSVGLIEHFDVAGTARAIRAHFDCAGPGAIVLATFPTPTWLYKVVRSAAERLGVWRFPDERPLASAEVAAEFARGGDILRSFINWRIVLTQGVVVAKKHRRM